LKEKDHLGNKVVDGRITKNNIMEIICEGMD
jgi:hypothetical protein